MTSLNRRRFIGAAIGTGAVAATAGSWTPAASADSGTGNRSRGVPNSRIGIQLYTMREKMGGDANRANVRRVLNRLDAYGYSEVELAGYAGFTAQQFRALLDNAGLNAVSGHDGVNIDPNNTTWQSDYEQTLENANVMGQQYTGLAWFPGPYDDASFWSFLAQRMNEAGELAKAAGLQFFYHNHNFEFENKQADGTPFFDLLLAETDPELVKFELDLYWIIRGEQNPLEYLTDHADRFFAYHVKDRTWGDRPNEEDFEDVGPGAIDFPDIFAVGIATPKHYFVEHDAPWLSHPGDDDAEFITARTGATYLKNVRF